MKKEVSKLKKALKVINNILGIILIIISDILFCLTYYVIKILKEVNFYEILYTFTSDTTGTGNSILIEGIKSCIIVFIVLLIILIIPVTSYKRIKIYIETKKKKLNIYPNIFSKFKILYGLILIIISILILAKTIEFDKYIETIIEEPSENETEKSFYEKYYKNTNEVKITVPKNKRNLILIYLESMESSLVSKENGGVFIESRIPELEELALNNLNFSNTEKIGGGLSTKLSSWTIAATFASTTGTPLSIGLGNDFDKLNNFIPSINALGDVLYKNGYNLELIQGSDKKFAGVDKYFTLHGKNKIFDLNTAKELGYINESYYTWWGFEDSKLFKYAKKEIEELSKSDSPFAVTMFTMDTHFQDGYLDSNCPKNFSDKYSNVYACSSKMINDFVSWIKEQDFYENTTVILLGDHLTMQNSYYEDYPDYTRTIYNVFINSGITTKHNKNRLFTAFDLYPTILASLNFKIEGNKLGFGTNLFSNELTMTEILGKDNFENEILKPSKYYKDNILNGVSLDEIGIEYVIPEEENETETTN